MLANVGLPMLMLGLPAMMLALVPIAGLEALWYRFALRLPWRRAWAGSWRANVWSTFLGLPLTWASLTALEFGVMLGALGTRDFTPQTLSESLLTSYVWLVVSSPWLVPLPGLMEMLVAAAGLVLLVPAYIVSYLGEARVLQRHWPDRDRARVRKHCWMANTLSYGVLFLLAWYRLYTLVGR